MRKLFLAPFIMIIILLSCASQVTITPELIEKTRLEYEKGNLTALNNLIHYYQNDTLSLELRQQALEALASTKNPDAYRAMRDFLNNAGYINYTLMLKTIRLLSATDDPDNLKSITFSLLESQKRFIEFRTEAMNIMEASNQSYSVEQLLGLYARSREDYTYMSQSISQLLAKLGDNRVIPILINIAKNKTLPLSVRSQAIEILARKKHPDITQLFIDMLKNPESQLKLRDFALQAMGDIQDARIIVALMEAYYSGRTEYFKLLDIVTRALSEFSDSTIAPTLVEIVTDQTIPFDIRKNALQGLMKLHLKEPYLQLLPMMEEPSGYLFYDEMKSYAEALKDPGLIEALRAAALKAQLKNEVK